MHARISTSPGPSTFNKSSSKLPSSPVPNYDVLAPDSYATAIGGRQARRRMGSTDDVEPLPVKSGLRTRSRSHSTHGNGNGNGQTHPLQANGRDRGADTRPVLQRVLSSKDGKAKGGMWGFSNGWVEEEDEEVQNEVRPSGPSREMLVHKIQPKDSLAGVALKYGVSIADIRKANKLWAADSIHLRSVLYIPLTTSLKLDLIDLKTPNQERDLSLPSDRASSSADDASKSNASDTPAPDPDKPTIQHVPLSQLSFFPPPTSPRKTRTPTRSVSSPFASNPPLLFTPGLSSASLMSSPLFSTSSPQLSSSPSKGVGSLSSLLSALPLPDAVQRLSIDSIAGGALTPRTASTPDISEQLVELSPMGTRSSPAGTKPRRTIRTQPTHGPVMTVPGRSVETGNEGRTTFATVDDDW
ncbi:hypothetical protein OPQ81_005883 [Rhizoctonia solani]|nr:hypothetical protein OPQ81_005883 [Rhizoctonia solani]